MTEHVDEVFSDDDERLSALLDGELPSEAAKVLEARLAAEPALARRLEAMRRTDQVLRERYGPVADEPLPAELAALVRGDGPGGTPASDPSSQGAVVPIRRAERARSAWIPSSIAAAIALAVGVTIGISLSIRDSLSDTERLLASNALISPDRELFDVLESLPSGETATLASDWTAMPRLTFQTAGSDYCREIALASSTGRTALVGCREDAGWRLQAVFQVPRAGIDNDSDGFRPASEPATELDRLVNTMIAGAPLGAEAEQAAIASGWE